MEGRGLPSLPIKIDLNGLSLNGAKDSVDVQKNSTKCTVFRRILLKT